MPTCFEIYKEFHSKSLIVLEKTFEEDFESQQSKANNFLLEFSKWLSILNERPEAPLLQSALMEYQYGLINISQGFYRQAYTSLRSFVEQSLAAIHFSGNEFELRLWMNGQQDIYWNNILDENNGIFSKRFVGIFAPSLIDLATVYREMAKIVYRECSEFTHSNYKTYSKIPQLFEYNKEVFLDWHDKAETAQILVTFSLCVRYLWTIKDEQQKRTIESSIMEYLGDVAQIRSYYDI